MYAGTGLPSLDPDDAKFFGVAGTNSQTLAGVRIILYVGVPAGSPSFSVGLFDGDVGGAWDSFTTSFTYRLFKDRLKNGTNADLVDTISSGAATDDDWFEKTYSTDNAAKAPSGNYFYRLEAGWSLGTPSLSFNNFKVRTTGQISVRAGQNFGFAAGPQNTPPGEDPWVGSGDPNPGDQNDPGANSYDGQFTYFFYVPTTLNAITFFDGDNDRAGDTNDPNTPDTDPDGAGPAEPEGANEGVPADGPSPIGACCNVDPSILYDILDSENHLFTNSNPSGNTEFERFVIGDSGSDPDVLVTYELQPGLWRYRVQGMDAHNLNVLRSTYEIYSNSDLPLTVSPSPDVFPDNTMRTPAGRTLYYSHTVKNLGATDDFNLDSSSAHGWTTAIYADSNGNGVLDPGEPKITQTGPMAPEQELDILLELVVPAGTSGVTDLATVTASSRSEWAVQGSATDTTIVGSPPDAALDPVDPVPEGTPVTLNASGSSDLDGDSLQYRWDFDGDGVWDTGWSPDPTATYTWGDDRSGIVRVEVTDGDLSDTAETTVVVFNVNPSLTNLTIDPSDPNCTRHDGRPCPLSQGFWKNHEEAWPVDSLMLGDETYSKAELLQLLRTPTRGDASLILARQLIAAKLNIANGSDPSPVQQTIQDADAVLAPFSGKLPYGVPPSSGTGQTMTALGGILDRYNNGLLTPECGGCPGKGDEDDDDEDEDDDDEDDDDDGDDEDDDEDDDDDNGDDDEDDDEDGDDGDGGDDDEDDDDCPDGDDDEDDDDEDDCDDEDDEDEEEDEDDEDDGGAGAPCDTFVFRATALDPGSDDLTFFWDFGDGTNASRTYFNDGTGPDPFPSPGPSFPFTATNETTHTYTTSGDFAVTLTVTDDDGGTVTIVQHVFVCVGQSDDDCDDDDEDEDDDDEDDDDDGDDEDDDEDDDDDNGDDDEDDDEDGDDGDGGDDDEDDDDEEGDGGCRSAGRAERCGAVPPRTIPIPRDETARP